MNPNIDRIRSMFDVSIHDAFDNLDDAKACAAEVFTCTIAAVGFEKDAYYLRPMDSKDSNIIAYIVITMKMKEW